MSKTRREFLGYLSQAGLVLGTLSKSTLAAAEEKLGHAELNIKFLMETMFPGSLATKSYDLLDTNYFLSLAVQYGLTSTPPKFITDRMNDLNIFIHGLLAADLDAGTKVKGHIFKRFFELNEEERIDVLKERLSHSPVAPAYELVRIVCLFAIVGTIKNDVGLKMLGLPRYENFADGLHNRGYADYSDNVVPSLNGVEVWNESIDGDIP
ncbi:MAG: hypothetical protein AB7T49_18980 [Oligoflexales bacterium]